MCLLLLQNAGKGPKTVPQSPPQVLALNSLHSSTPKCVTSKHCAIPALLLVSPPHKFALPLLEQSENDGTPSLGWHSKSTEARVEISAQRHSCAKQHLQTWLPLKHAMSKTSLWIDEWTKMSVSCSIYNSWLLLSLWSPPTLSLIIHTPFPFLPLPRVRLPCLGRISLSCGPQFPLEP